MADSMGWLEYAVVVSNLALTVAEGVLFGVQLVDVDQSVPPSFQSIVAVSAANPAPAKDPTATTKANARTDLSNFLI
jgi:hypothetical protein